MNKKGIFTQGYCQDASVIDKLLNLPEVPEVVKEIRDNMWREVNKQVADYKYQIERIYNFLLADGFNVLVKNLETNDAPEVYTEMRRNIMRGHQEISERHLLTFLHEFHDSIDAEFVSYKSGDPNVNPRGPHAFMINSASDRRSSPIPVNYTTSQRREAEQELIDALGPGTSSVVCYSTGNIQLHFQEYFRRLYNLSMKMREFIDYCSECSWINQSITNFRGAGQILIGEIGGVIFKYTASQAVHDADFSLRAEYRIGTNPEYQIRVISPDDVNKEVPLIYGFLGNMRLLAEDNGNQVRYVPNAIEDENVLLVRNTGEGNITINKSDTQGNPVEFAPGQSTLTVNSNQERSIPAKHFREIITFGF